MENSTHTYPEEILPGSDFIIPLEIDALHNEGGPWYVQRRRGDFSKESGTYPDYIMPSTFGANLAGMSVNLMGGRFAPVHVCFEPKEVVDFMPESQLLPVEAVKFEYCADNQGVYIDTQVHGMTFPSSRAFDKKDEMQKVENALKDSVAAFVKNRQYDVYYKIKLRHAPTLQNYWHWQIEVYPLTYEGHVVKKEKSAWQKDLFRAFVNFLIPFATLSVPMFKAIPQRLYMCS